MCACVCKRKYKQASVRRKCGETEALREGGREREREEVREGEREGGRGEGRESFGNNICLLVGDVYSDLFSLRSETQKEVP